MHETITETHSTAPSNKAVFSQLRRYFLYAFIAVGVLMFVLDYLASSVGSDTQEARAVDFETQSIAIAIAEEPPQLNSSLATDAVSGMVLGHIMEGLLRMGVDDQLEAGIAERWEVTPETATFWLRKDARWSDGEPITAKDFLFAWQTALDPDNASEYAFLLYAIKNAEAINQGNLPLTDLGVRIPDPHTLVVELERPVPFFDKMVVFPTFLPIRQDFYEATGGRFGADAKDLLYSGPFVMASWVHGSSLLLQKNPYYWDKDRIRLNEINVAYITSDVNARINFFKDERIAFTGLQAENLIDAMRQKWPIKRYQDGTVFFLEFNHREDRLSENLNFRRALQSVLDMEELVYKVTKLPGYRPGESLFPTFLMGVEKSFRQEYPATKIPVDYAQARAYLAQAKEELGLAEWPEFVLLCGDNPISNIQSEWVQGALKKHLGLTLKIDKQIFKQRLAKMTAGDFDLVLAGWGPDYNDPLTFGDLFASWNLNNRGRYASPEMDRLIAVAQNASTPQSRMEAFAGIQQLIIDDAVILPMYERGLTYVLHPKLKGVKRRVIGADTDFTNAYVER
ncbi:MAG TPA: hypothetical protein DER02_03610 [Gammaproteobacteria bacterium]|nr:hypothetical protein [Gammaproteobacteria bacterium]